MSESGSDELDPNAIKKPDHGDPSTELAGSSRTVLESQEEELRNLRQVMSGKKRSITVQIKNIERDLVSDPLPSRTALKYQLESLKKTLSELKTAAGQVLQTDLSDPDRDGIETYLANEERRINICLGTTVEHIEARADEATTIITSRNPGLRRFQDEERARLNRIRDQKAAQIGRLERENEEIRSKMESLELGPRAMEFDSCLPPRPIVMTNWMSQPSSETGPSGGKSTIRSEMPVFSGKPLEFTNWSNLFQSLVHTTNKSPAEKMGLLRMSLSPSCQQLIAGFSNNEQDYHEALRLIHKRFGHEKLLQRAHLQAIRDIPKVASNDPSSFSTFADSLQGHLRVVNRLYPRGDGMLLSLMFDLEHKLDEGSFLRWRDFSGKVDETDRIHAFGEWSMDYAEELRYFHSEKEVIPISSKKQGSFHVLDSQVRVVCRICREPHKERHCQKFKNASNSQRREMARNFGMCFLCLEVGHRAWVCPRKKEMSCHRDGCGRGHHMWLHEEDRGEEHSATSKNSSPITSNVNSVNFEARLGIIPVTLYHKGNKIMVSALVDEGSDTSLVSDEVRKKLKIPRPSQFEVTMNLVSEKAKFRSGAITLEISGSDSARHALVAMTMPTVCKNLRAFSWSGIQKKVRHLCDLPIVENDRKVEILIGADHLHLISPQEIRRGSETEPQAFRCSLGWVIRGRLPINTKREPIIQSNFAVTESGTLEEQVRRFMESERFGSEGVKDRGPIWSQEEAFAMKLIEEQTFKLNDEPGYCVSLPWKSTFKPQNDQEIAMRRFRSLQRKMSKSHEFAEDYIKAIQTYLESGYAKKVMDEVEKNHLEQRWLPHHGVYKDPTKRKLRVVFDSAAKYSGLSLNDCLFTGPTLQNELILLLLGFREYPVAVTADIEAMYSRIFMNQEDARFHRFLWTEDVAGQPELYEMTRVVFGDSPSPCQAIHVLQRTVEDFGTPRLLEVVQNRFYMDDFLNSYKSEMEAIRTGKDLTRVLRNGNFNLAKWVSNSIDVVQEIRETAPRPREDMDETEQRPSGISLGHVEGKVLVLPQEWRYVPGEQNPADYATRSQLQDQAIAQDWIDGPRFLCQVENMWPKDLNVPKNLDEIKKDFQNFQVSSERSDGNVGWFEGIKDLKAAERKLLEEVGDESNISEILIKRSQRESFPLELEALSRNIPLPKTSRILALTPFLDPKGIARTHVTHSLTSCWISNIKIPITQE
ncbi:uncharacterized protein LOC131878169 [Tigriopus californicus]|uniref:uncharacterized protein LOC131878169 n=1 Tax=Tigriopus californicus TaxID=6832 RepID=UPI0027DAB11D|nr:uncharacterized protein LOC131878169 [Tigriopus californicus]